MKSTLNLGNEGVTVGALLMKALNPPTHRSRGYDSVRTANPIEVKITDS